MGLKKLKEGFWSKIGMMIVVILIAFGGAVWGFGWSMYENHVKSLAIEVWENGAQEQIKEVVEKLDAIQSTLDIFAEDYSVEHGTAVKQRGGMESSKLHAKINVYSNASKWKLDDKIKIYLIEEGVGEVTATIVGKYINAENDREIIQLTERAWGILGARGSRCSVRLEWLGINGSR